MIFMLNFHGFLHTMYKYMLNYVVKISVMSAEHFEYYTIILGGGVFSWRRCTCSCADSIADGTVLLTVVA